MNRRPRRRFLRYSIRGMPLLHFGLVVAILWAAGCSADLANTTGSRDTAQKSDHSRSPSVVDYPTAPDAEFNRLFTRSGPGWTGGDGTYSVQLPDGRTVWLFGDTFLGHVSPDRSRSRQSPFIRNSIVIQNHHLDTRFGQRHATPSAFIIPHHKGQWYWPADGTVSADRLWVFYRRLESIGSGMWQWRYEGTDLAAFILPEIRLLKITPIAAADRIRYGAAVLETKRFIYIYGIENNTTRKYMHLARTPIGRMLKSWRYFNGNDWDSEPAGSARLLEGVVDQFSVVKVDQQFCLVTMDGRVPFSNHIVAYAAAAPTGPWKGPVTVYIAPEANGDIVAYNACTHPQFTDASGRILISYNLNHIRDPDAVYADADLYRPRFIRVDLKKVIDRFKF